MQAQSGERVRVGAGQRSAFNLKLTFHLDHSAGAAARLLTERGAEFASREFAILETPAGGQVPSRSK